MYPVCTPKDSDDSPCLGLVCTSVIGSAALFWDVGECQWVRVQARVTNRIMDIITVMGYALRLQSSCLILSVIV